MPRFAANISCLFADRPLPERAAAAAAAGFAAVEALFPYDTPAGELREALARHDLTMLGINTERGGEGQFGLAALPGREAEFETLFLEALDYIVAVGGRSIHCMAGTVSPGQRGLGERTFIANLSRAADRAAEHGITLLIEPLNTRDRPDYFLTTAEQAADILMKLGKPNVRMQFDFYHMQIMGGDLLHRFEKHLQLIGHVQISSVPSRHEPDQGEINYAEVCRAIDALGYTGFVAAEYVPRGRTEDGIHWLNHMINL